LSSADISNKGGLQMWTFARFGAKKIKQKYASKFMVCPHGQGEEGLS